MRTQILKGVVAATLVLALAGVAAPVHAAQVRAQVPFGFEVGQKTLPPGTYDVSTTPANGLIFRGYSTGAIVLGMRTESPLAKGTPRLVFNRYGDTYILREVWMDSTSGHKLPESKRERELAGSRNGGATASATVERVEVAVQ